jgi:hypothetical protein
MIARSLVLLGGGGFLEHKTAQNQNNLCCDDAWLLWPVNYLEDAEKTLDPFIQETIQTDDI